MKEKWYNLQDTEKVKNKIVTDVIWIASAVLVAGCILIWLTNG